MHGDDKTRISFQVEIPDPSAKGEPRQSMEEKAEDALEAIEARDPDPAHWDFIRKLNNTLVHMRKCGECTEKQLKLLRRIAPTVNKFALTSDKRVDVDPLAASKNGEK